MAKVILTLFILICSTGLITSLNLCGEWTQYNSVKCIKVIKDKATEEEARANCTQLESTSDLLTIHSKEEQEFLNNLLVNYNNISNNAWIGMMFTNKSYKWMDGSQVNYSDWAEDAIRDGSEPCVQMSLVKATLGKWNDEPCKRTALIVCQKKPVLNLNLLRESIEKMEKLFDSLIPIGFLYTQLPDKDGPEVLWPHLKWTEVTDQYSGLFFRAEGNGSLAFGEIQVANQSLISTISTRSYISSNYLQYASSYVPQELNGGQWYVPNATYGINSFEIYTTKGEVRPKNTAVKIWERIE